MNEEQFNKFMEAMTKSVKGLALNYATLSAQLKDTRVNQLHNNFYRGGRPQINYKWERKGELKYHNCGEIGHAAKNYNYNKTKTISFCEIEETNNDKVHTLDNITSQKTEKRKLRKEVRMPQKQSEREQNMEVDSLPPVQDPTPLNKTKEK
ncbi:3341_t:CDS:2, partial [Gigaspora margarita]